MDSSNEGLVEWVFVEKALGVKGDTYYLAGENHIFDATGASIVTYTVVVTGTGEDILSFVHGDVSKMDDAIQGYKEDPLQAFSVIDMDGTEYSQVRIIS